MILGRRFRPLGLALALATFAVFVINATDVGVLDGWLAGDIIGACGIIASLLLLVGWWLRRPRVYRAGLLAAFAMWLFRAVLIALLRDDALVVVGLYLSLAWAVAAGGAYLLERPTKRVA